MSILVGTASWTDPTLSLPSSRRTPATTRCRTARFPRSGSSARRRTSFSTSKRFASSRAIRRRATPSRKISSPRLRRTAKPISTTRTCPTRFSTNSGGATSKPSRRFTKRANRARCISSSRPGSPRDRTGLHTSPTVPPGYPMAVEFRNPSWFDDTHIASTLAFERERGLVQVVVDEPRGGANTIPAVWNATNDKLAPAREYRRRDCAAVHTLKLPHALSAF